MRKAMLVIGGGIAVTMFAAAPAALAATGGAPGSPHFIANQTSDSITANGSLVAQFKEAGLPSGAVEHIVLDATATANWFCVNGGAHNPSASNKRSVSTPVSASGDFGPVDKNGNLVGSLTISSASLVPAGFSCPSGQSLTLGSVSYIDVSITDDTSGAYLQLADRSSGCLLSGVKFAKDVTCVG
jgi:hypothetical protein